VRDLRATAIASWSSNAHMEGSTARPGPREYALIPSPVRAGATGTAVTAVPRSPTSQPQPVIPLTGESAAAEPAGETSPAAPAEILPAEPTATSAPVQAAALELPVSAPLLLSDPSFSNLTQLDEELARSARGRPVQIRYLEAALNREIATLLATAVDVPYRNVTTDLGAGSIVVSGDVTVLGIAVRAEAEGRLRTAYCRPRIELTRVKIGKLFTPKAVRDEVEALLEDALDWYPATYPLCIEEIVVQEGRVTIYGSRR
jgi:hypothetical protein